MTKSLNIKELSKEQLRVIRHINNQIIEHQQVFDLQPEELLVTKEDFKLLSGSEELDKYKYLLLGSIKIYHI